MRSPRLVPTSQRALASSQRRSLTSVWKQAFRYRSYFFPIALECERISGARVYFSFGT